MRRFIFLGRWVAGYEIIWRKEIEWPKLERAYTGGAASAEGYTVDEVELNLSDKNQKWLRKRYN